MTKIKHLVALAILSLLTSSLSPLKTMAQESKKLFTLEDLNFGGNNYRNLLPENKWLTWWGDELVRTDIEECYLVDKKTGQEKLLFTLDDINKWAQSNDDYYVRHLHSASFPYPDKPIVAVGNKKAFTLVDFTEQTLGNSEHAMAMAFVGIRAGEGRPMVYGAGEHTNIDRAAVAALVSALNLRYRMEHERA
jgi:dipeptidyl-peptidase-4